MATKVWKKYKEAAKLIEPMKRYSLEEGVELVKKVNYAKFKGSVEIHIKTFADPKYNDQMLRWTVVLPHGNGKTVRIGAFVSDEKIDEAKALWVDVVGSSDLLKKIEDGQINFDVLITTNDMMRDLAKVAKILWPKGLMPSPKAWTVTNDLKSTVDEIKKWRVEYKLDKTGNLHVGVGKVDFDSSKLLDNINALLKSIEENKPAWVKGKLIKKLVLAPTMGPGVLINM